MAICETEEKAMELANKLNLVLKRESFNCKFNKQNQEEQKGKIRMKGFSFISEFGNVVKETTENTAKFFKVKVKIESKEETKQIINISPYKRMADGRVIDVKVGKGEQTIKIKK